MTIPALNSGTAVSAAQVAQAAAKKKRLPAEPQGRGLRVVMQRLSITAPRILERPFMFQVPPLDEFARQHAWDHTDYDTIAAGYRSRPGSTQPVSISFDSMFVDHDAPYVVNKANPRNPVALVDEIIEIGNAKTPFQLLVGQPDLWGVYYDVNIAATLRSFRPSERAGEIDTRYYTATFTEFKGISQSELAQGLQGDLGRSGNRTVAVLAIDQLPPKLGTLRDISKHYYGTSTLWAVIAKASGLSAPGSVKLRDFYARASPKPKVVVPAPAIAKAASR